MHGLGLAANFPFSMIVGGEAGVLRYFTLIS